MAVLGCVVELLDDDPMVHCVVSCRQVYKNCTGNHASLVTIFDMVSEIKQLTGNDFPGRKPACSFIRCCSSNGDTLFKINLSYTL